MSELRNKVAELVERYVEDVLGEGLTWDEAVTVFGLAIKASAQAAANAGDGTLAECLEHARDTFESAFATEVQVVVAGEAATDSDCDEMLLSTAHLRHHRTRH